MLHGRRERVPAELLHPHAPSRGGIEKYGQTKGQYRLIGAKYEESLLSLAKRGREGVEGGREGGVERRERERQGGGGGWEGA
jgi:hypothetical protein